MASMERNVHVEENIEERADENWGYEFPVVNQLFTLMSIVDTEDKNLAAAVKIFGCYPSEDAANAAAKKISAECDFFHVYVCPNNAWIPVPPSRKMIEDVTYQESRMNDIRDAFVALKQRGAKDVIRHLEKEAKLEDELEEKKGEEHEKTA